MIKFHSIPLGEPFPPAQLVVNDIGLIIVKDGSSLQTDLPAGTELTVMPRKYFLKMRDALWIQQELIFCA